jgi:hypothetical protein
MWKHIRIVSSKIGAEQKGKNDGFIHFIFPSIIILI